MDLEERLTSEGNDLKDEMPLSEFVDFALDNPDRAGYSSAAEYLYSAITHYGTRTVVEDGERLERWRFFDDPENNGENAVFGNTKMLNELTDTIYRIAKSQSAKMPSIRGKTGTGKSELKNCLKNGLRYFSETEEGQLYTLAMPDVTKSDVSPRQVGNSFANWNEEYNGDNMQRSVIQSNPLAAIKHADKEEGESIEDELYENRDSIIEPVVPEKLDPVLGDILRVVDEEIDDISVGEFLNDYAKVVSTTVNDGRGIGEIKSEEQIDHPYTKLFAEPKPEQDPSDPRNWSFNGAFTNGNRGVAIIDDADQFAPVLPSLQSMIDDNRTKFHGNGSIYSVDTVPILIYNPGDMPPLEESFERRQVEFDMDYLTNYAVESELLRKMMGEDWDLLDDIDPEEASDVIRRPMNTLNEEREEGNRTVEEVEFAPHSLEYAAMAEVASRLEDDTADLIDETWEDIKSDASGRQSNQDLTLIEKVELYRQGFIERELEGNNGDSRTVRLEKDDFEFPEDSQDGRTDGSMNVTFARDVLEAAQESLHERGKVTTEDGEEIDLSNVLLHYDVADEFGERIESESTVSDEEHAQKAIDDAAGRVDEYIADDILRAIFHGKGASSISSDDVDRYLDMVQAYEGDDTYRNSQGRMVQPDETELMETEKSLFNFSDDDYRRGDPNTEVENFRNDISIEVSKKATAGNLPDDLTELDEVEDRMGRFSWKGIQNINGGKFKEWNPKEWTDHGEHEISLDQNTAVTELSTDTAQVKSRAIRNMVEHQDYSPASAILVADEFMRRNSDEIS